MSKELTRREQNVEQTRELILDAAREVFVASGYESTSIREVARRAGISHGTIYLHFRDKDDLLFQVSEDEFGRLLGRLRALPRTQDPVQRLGDALRAFGLYGLDNPHQYQLMMGHRPSTFSENDVPRFGPMAEQASAFLGDLRREAARRGFLSSTTGHLDHLALIVSMHGIIDMFELQLIDRSAAQEGIEHTISLLLGALSGGVCEVNLPASHPDDCADADE
jgi:AcrR family transcriptional regulator